MRVIRTFYRAIGMVYFLAILAIGAAGTYFQYSDRAQMGYLFGWMNVDPKASVVEQAQQFAQGYSDGASASDAIHRQPSGDQAAARAEAERRAAAAGWGPGQAIPAADH